jgi:hypothetical protein
MRWFRGNIWQGSWGALIALAINLALSFGHVHAIDGRGVGHDSSVLFAAVAAPDADERQGHSDGHADDLCPICVAAAAIATALTPTPPVVQVEFAAAIIDSTIARVASAVESPCAAFQSRGPPIS